MTILKFIIVLLTFSLFTSCNRNYKLSEEDYKWMPYQGNEILVFSSNTGDIDTIFFLRKDTLTAYPEAQNPFGITYESVTIFCKHSDPWPPDGRHRYLENYFCAIDKSKDKKAGLNLNLSAKDAVFYKLGRIRIDSLAKQNPKIFQTNFKTYDDVYIINDEDWLNFKERSDYVTKLYWSKSEGLIRYEKKNGVYWELIKKYNP